MEILIAAIVAGAMLIVFAIIGAWLVARDRKEWRQRTMQMAMETDPRIKADVERRLKKSRMEFLERHGLTRAYEESVNTPLVLVKPHE